MCLNEQEGLWTMFPREGKQGYQRGMTIKEHKRW